MSSAVYTLPFDVLALIATFIDSKDLARLCATSSVFLSAFRPLLYRVVSLPFGPNDTLELLARDKNLASVVLDLVLFEQAGPFRRMINWNAFENMTSLRSITLHGFIFSTDYEQLQFAHVISRRTRSTLQRITHTGSRSPLRRWHTDMFGAIPEFKIIEWLAPLYGPCICILTSSFDTCHTLCLPIDAFVHAALQVHFRNLRSVTVHLVYRNTLTNDCKMMSDCFTKFLSSHDTIQELDTHRAELFWHTVLSDESITVDFLPHLRSFAGSTVTCKTMALKRMKCFSTTLRRLRICPVLSRRFLQLMLEAILHLSTDFGQAHSTLVGSLALQEIHLVFSYEYKFDVKDAEMVIRLCAECFGPSLEVWSETLSDGIHPDQVRSLFGLFKKLRVLDLNTKGVHFATDRSDVVRTFARHCLALRTFRLNGHSWMILRDTPPSPNHHGDNCPSPDCSCHFIYV